MIATYLRERLKELTARERRILELSFGLDEDGKEQNLADIAKGIGLSRERVRQIEAGALMKMKKLCMDLNEIN